MKKSSRRTLSRLLAGVMLVTSIVGSTVVSGAEGNVSANADVTTSGGSTDITTSGSGLGTPEAGKSYSADYTVLEVNSKLNGITDESGTIKIVSPNDESYVHDASHGAALFDGDQIQIAVAGNATVSLTLCEYGNGTEFTVTDEAGNTVGTFAAKGETDGEVASIDYIGEATTLTLTLSATGEAYLHSVKVDNKALPTGEAESFTYWLDDEAVPVEGVDEETGAPTTIMTVEPGVRMFADSKLELIGNGDTKFTPERPEFQNVELNGRTVNFYKAGSRHATANDIPSIPVAGTAEAGTSVLFTPAAAGTVTIYYYSSSFVRVWDFDATTGERYGYVDDADLDDRFYAFKAEPGHTYVMSTTGKTNNCAYAGLEYIVDEPVTTPVSTNNISANESSLASLEIYLTDAYLGGDPEAVVTTSTDSVNLTKGHTYAITTNDGGVGVTVNGSDTFVASEEAVVFDLVDIPDQTLTGTITGTDAGTVTGITFTNMVNNTVTTGTVNADMTYTVQIKPGDYNTAVTTTNGGVTYDRVSVVQGAENVNEVYVELPQSTGTFSPDAMVNFITAGTAASRGNDFTAKSDAVLTIPVSGATVINVTSYFESEFTINGAAGAVAGGSTSGSTSQYDTVSYRTDGTETAVTITFGTTYSTNYLTSIEVIPVVEFKSEISVPGDYDTLKDAVTAIKAMDRPEGEEGRVTINLTADIQEQIVFDAPYITLNGNGHEISWYYGVGTLYYSVDPSTGLYNERLFRDKYSSTEGNGSLWGGVAIIRGDYFTAVDTVFRNTYNYEVVEKEIEDFAGATGNLPDRTAPDVDVTAYAAKERSNAFYIEAKNISVYNCQILSSQDTLGRNGSANNGYSAYFKDCVIGGNTDYICGEFAAIFDNCELQWKTFAHDPSNNGKVGYITAPKTNPYIFRNCTITTDGVGDAEDVSGLYGRTWGANSNATFINTETNGFILDTGWGQMSAGEAATAKFQEYNNTSNGEPFETKSDVEGLVNVILTDEQAAAYIGDAGLTTAYGEGNTWIPYMYSYEEVFRGTWGDVDQSGVLTANDAAAVLAYSLDASIANDSRYNFAGADVSDDNIITANDAAMILQKVLDAGFQFPAEPVTEAPTETTTMEIESANEYLPEAKAENAFAGTIVYNGNYGSIEAFQNMKYNVIPETDGVVTINGHTYSGYAASTSSNTNLQINGAIDETGAPVYRACRIAYVVTANQDTNVSVDVKVNSGKAVYLTTDDVSKDNSSFTSLDMLENSGADTWTTVSANIKAGETLYILGQGTNLPIYGIYFTDPVAEPTNTVDVFIVGDSTGCDYGPNDDATLYYKRVGFGTAMPEYFTDEVNVVNLALSGRSSKSFTTEANYQTLKDSIGEGDYLIIAFGHNDEKDEDASRYTDPIGDKDTEGSFKNSLYVNYIQVAQAAGATPILCTPTVRRTDSGTWSDAQLHIDNGGDYAQCVRDLGAELGLTVIDNTQMTKDLYDQLTPSESVYLHSWSNEASTSVDNTHLNNYGAHYVAYMMADAIAKSTSGLAAYVKSDIAAPAKDAYLVVNPGYVAPTSEDLIGEDLESTLWTTADGWYGTAFGDIGGTTKLYGQSMQFNPETGQEEMMTDYTKLAVADNSESGEPNFFITGEGTNARVKVGEILSTGTKNSYGKIAGTSDGLAMYYMPTSDVNFELSADITINSYDSTSNQVAFGAIAADSILVNENNKIAIQNWVSAGPLKFSTTTPTYWSTFARLDGTLTAGTEKDMTDIPQVGETVHVSIVKKGQNYTVTFGDDTYTFENVATSGYVYAGFYAARCADISVSNISYNNEITE